MKRVLFLLALLLVTAGSYADEVKPFVRGSQQAILSANQGKPFILALWSLDCPYCRDDLTVLGKALARHRNLKIVMVTTDSPAQGSEIQSTLKQFQLQKAESWAFADSFTERLQHEIDPQWHGELPRLYLYDSAGKATAFSGKVAHQKIEQWIKANALRETK